MMTYHSTLTAFVASLLACACTAELPEDGSSSDELRTAGARKSKTVQIATEDCPDYYDEGGVRPLTPGTTLILSAPSSHDVEELFGFAPELVPGWTVTKGGGRTKLQIQIGPDPVEFFSGVSRIMTTGPRGSHQCYFDVRAKNVVQASAYEWLGGSVDAPITIDRDLGEVPLGGTVLIEGAPFGDSQSLTTRVPSEGGAEPTRITATGGTNGTYVFEATDVGEAHFDLRVFLAGYSNHVSHVHWRVTR